MAALIVQNLFKKGPTQPKKKFVCMFSNFSNNTTEADQQTNLQAKQLLFVSKEFKNLLKYTENKFSAVLGCIRWFWYLFWQILTC
jgi:hypothetical protein